MKEFKKTSQILWKKNRIWIIMIIALFLLTQSLTAQSEIERMKGNIFRVAAGIEWLDEENLDLEDVNVDNSYNDIGIIEKQLNRQYEDGIPEDFFTVYNEKFKVLADKYNFKIGQTPDEFYKPSERNYDGVKYRIQDLLYDYDSQVYSVLYRNNGHPKLDFTKKLFQPGFGIFFVMLLMGFLFTSLEHLTPYYEFTRMLPWSKSKTYFSKVAFGGIISLLAYFASIGLRYGVWSSSILNNIIGISQIFNQGFIFILIVLGFYFMVVGLGTVSGNVLGHMGMLLIGFLGIQLWIYNALGISYLIFGDLPNTYWVFRLSRWINTLPGHFQVLLGPYSIFDLGIEPIETLKVIIFFLLGLAYLALGWFWSNRNNAERSGMLIMRKSVSLYAQIFAVLTTSISIFMIFRTIMVGNRIINIAVFIVGFLLSYLFYKKLFKVRIGI